MFDGIILALTILTMVTLAFGVWAALRPRQRADAARWLLLAALGLACGVAASAAYSGPHLWPELFWGDAWARITVAIWLGLGALWALLTWRTTAGADAALDLLAVAGGALALAARDGLLCWVGVTLLVIAAKRAKAEGLVGVGAMLYGLALLYYRVGALDLAALSRWLWAQGGPPDLAILAGVALTLGGLALLTGLLPPYAADAKRGPLPSILGLMVLARFCHGGFSALAEAWCGALIGAGLAAWAWGILMALRRGTIYRAPTLTLTVMQRGFLLVALGLSARAEHWPGFWLALAAWALGQSVHDAVWREAQGAGQPLDGLLWVRPALGAPLLMALASLAGLPLLLGFVGRARLLWAAWGESGAWLAALSALASALTAARYWPLIVSLTRRREGAKAVGAASWQMALGLALAALALVALGLYPAPLIALARRMML